MPEADWWKSYFDAQYLREYEPIFTEQRDRHEVGRLVELLGLPQGAKVLDVPCGQGRHARLLAEAGFDVEGLDYSDELLAIARQSNPGEQVSYRKGDMRHLPARWRGAFDAVLNLFTSFGFFLDPADDRRVVAEFAQILAPGGLLVWHGGSRDGIMRSFLARDWWRTDDGTMIGHERSFDSLSGVLTVQTSWSGPDGGGERSHRIRLYNADRLAELFASEGLIVEQAYDAWSERPLTRGTTQMLLVARKSELPAGSRAR